MNKITYFRACLFMPIAAPLILLYAKTDIGGVLSWSILYGGPIYLPFCATLLYWSLGKTEDQVFRMALKSPILFTISINLAYILMSIYHLNFSNISALRSVGSGAIFITFASLFLGYIYVSFLMILYYFTCSLIKLKRVLWNV